MSSPVDWELAQRVAARAGGRPVGLDSFHYRSLSEDFAELTPRAETLVEAETGLRSLEGPARARVVDRGEWVGANIESFQRLLRPVTDKLTPKGPARLGAMTRRASGTEVGLLLGWMSKRVLGQYDLLLTEDVETRDDQDMVYYVGPNIVALERRHGFPPRQFRLWLALHEVTHRMQFTGVPWLREHFISLVESTLDAVDPDPKRMMEAVKGAIESKRRGEDPLADGGLPALFATPEQRETLDKIGGMMSLLEGHGDMTMDRAGADQIPSADRFGEVLRQRRASTKGVAKVFQRLIGLEAKMNQYAAGEAFIERVEAAGGPELVNRAWEMPANLPTMDEIRSPDLWIDRIRVDDAIAD